MIGLKLYLTLFLPKPSSLVFIFILVNDTSILSVTQTRNLGYPHLAIFLQSLSCVDSITFTCLKSVPFSPFPKLLPQLKLLASLAQIVVFIFLSAAMVTFRGVSLNLTLPNHLASPGFNIQCYAAKPFLMLFVLPKWSSFSAWHTQPSFI